jgi:hypothetical protein
MESEFHLFFFISAYRVLFLSNIEDIARDAGSIDIDEESLCCKSNSMIVQLKFMFC